jgi:uncharacterized protein YjiS (DUF1127 family)
MTTLDHATLPLAGTPRAVRFARVRQMVLNFVRALRNRREIYRLGMMTDTELADIGLTRSDLHVAVRSPFGIDPTATLGAIATARARNAEYAARSIC